MKPRRYIAVTVLVLAITHPTVAQQCSQLPNKASSAEVIGFLEKNQNAKDGDPCVALGLRRLAYDRTAAATLIKFLTFRYRDPECEYIGGGRCMSTGYIATESLMEIGEESLPFILDAIKSPSTSDLALENALDVYYYFVRDDNAEGVAALKWEADQSHDPGERSRLSRAAANLANKWCFRFYKPKSKCEAALNGKLPFNYAKNTSAVQKILIHNEPSPWSFEEYAVAKRTVASDRLSNELRSCKDPRIHDNAEYASAYQDFLERNQTPTVVTLRNVGPWDKQPVLIGDAQIARYRARLRTHRGVPASKLVPDDQWGISGPLLSLSQVGFSRNRGIAIAYVQHECASSCSGSGLHVLQRHSFYWTEEPGLNCK